MTILNIENSLVVVIDVQEKLLNSVFNKDSCEKNSRIVTGAASILGIPVVATEQYPKGLGSTVDAVKQQFLSNNANVFEKITFSALQNEDVLNAIKNSGRKQIVIFGIETHICVSQTTEAQIGRAHV